MEQSKAIKTSYPVTYFTDFNLWIQSVTGKCFNNKREVKPDSLWNLNSYTPKIQS